MLRKIRIIVALLVYVLITLLFLDFTGTMHIWFGWLARIQFLPAVLALNVGVVLFLVLLTGVFGRVYCSVICPLGVMQDGIAWFGKRKKKLPYSYSPARSWLRYGVLVVFVVALLAGIGGWATLLAPYSSYGRIVNNLFQPLWQWGNNLLAYLAERVNSYAFYEVDVWLKSLPTFLIAVVTFAVLAVLAWRNGRTYCNTVCPVGTVLGWISRFSLFRVTIDEEKCNKCGLCARHCKAACIQAKEHRIDYSRCVVCLNCIGTCKRGAIDYKLRKKQAVAGVRGEESQKVSSKQIDAARRGFLSAATLLAANSILQAQEKKVDGGLAAIKDKKIPHRFTPIVPPGALSARNMANHCTACQLCVSSCPNGVLRPSADVTKFMQPEMSYERGYCRPECVKCAEVCPAGAIRPIDVAEKSSIQVGHAVWVKENCVVLTDGVECGNCARHCPTEAILMVAYDPDDPEGAKIPVVNVERCIGCGACENLCPARPFSAIYVEGHENHRIV